MLYEVITQLIEEVKRRDADFGIAFDGDADRIGVVLPNADILYGDDITMLLAEDVVKNNPLAKIVVDVKVSQNLIKHIKEIGGEPIVWKTGHSFIKRKMLEEGALLAGDVITSYSIHYTKLYETRLRQRMYAKAKP